MAERLRCESGEFKTRAQFSKRQLDKYDVNRRKGTATAFKTGIHCLEHSNTQNLELKCLGPCRRTRALRFFSKNTRRNGKNWCVDCTDWQLKSEIGDTLPPPGTRVSAEELESIRRPFLPRDDMASEYDVESFDDTEVRDSNTVFGGCSNFAGNGSVSGSVSALSSSAQYSLGPDSVIDEDANEQASVGTFSARPAWARDSLVDEEVDGQANTTPSYFGNEGRAPHWLMPDLGELPTGLSMATSTAWTDGASVASSGMTVSARGPWGQPVAGDVDTASVANSEMTTSTRVWEDGTSVASSRPQGQPQRHPVSFNAWGPHGEFERRVKNPTVVSGSTRTEPAARPSANLGRGGWAKVSSRKHAPQLPDYLKYDYDIPAVADDEDELDLDSDDDEIRIPSLSAASAA